MTDCFHCGGDVHDTNHCDLALLPGSTHHHMTDACGSLRPPPGSPCYWCGKPVGPNWCESCFQPATILDLKEFAADIGAQATVEEIL